MFTNEGEQKKKKRWKGIGVNINKKRDGEIELQPYYATRIRLVYVQTMWEDVGACKVRAKRK